MANYIKITVVLPLLFAVVLSTTPVSAQAGFAEDMKSLLSQIATLVYKVTRQNAAVITAYTTLVSNQEELLTALASAKGGETIALKPGDYGHLSLYDGRQPYVVYPSNVTITSQDTTNRAKFSKVQLSGVQNLTFDNIHFKYDFVDGDAEYNRTLLITNGKGYSKNITIKNSLFEGDIAKTGSSAVKGFGFGIGLSVDGRGTINTSNIVIENNIFTKWLRGATFGNIKGLTVRGNELHSIRSDGMDFALVQDVLIENNYFHDFKGSPTSLDHMDMIQFWTNGAKDDSMPTKNITIRGNLLMAGTQPTQSIFMRNDVVDRGLFGESMYYQNVLIENNVIFNGHAHGITVGESNGLTIRNNTLLHDLDAGNSGSVSLPKINNKPVSKNLSVTKNIIADKQPDTLPAGYSDNLYAQRDSSFSPNYYPDLFLNALADKDATEKDLRAYPDSVVVKQGYGAASTRAITADSNTHVFIKNTSQGGLDMQTINFSAFAHNKNGSQEVQSVSWKFGDGSTGSGQSISHTYTKPGKYEVEATLSYSGGQAKAKRIIYVETPVALAITFDQDATDSSPFETKLVTNKGTVGEGTANINSGIFSYARDAEVRNNQAYTIAFDFKKSSSASTGRVIYYSGSYILSVEKNSINDSGKFNFPAAVEDTNWHTMVYTFDGNTGIKTVYVDGVQIGSHQDNRGVMLGSVFHDFSIGNPFGAGFDGLVDNVYLLRGALSATQVASYEATGILPVKTDVSAVSKPVIPVPPEPAPTIEDLFKDTKEKPIPDEVVKPTPEKKSIDKPIKTKLEIESEIKENNNSLNKDKSTVTPTTPSANSRTPIPNSVQNNSQSSKYNFTRPLTIGSKGEDVRNLQRFLNSKGYYVSPSGDGAPGKETTYFGPATRNALIKYQNAHRAQVLTPVGEKTGTGYFGPATMKFLNSQAGATSDTPITNLITMPTSREAIIALIQQLLIRIAELRQEAGR